MQSVSVALIVQREREVSAVSERESGRVRAKKQNRYEAEIAIVDHRAGKTPVLTVAHTAEHVDVTTFAELRVADRARPESRLVGDRAKNHSTVQ